MAAAASLYAPEGDKFVDWTKIKTEYITTDISLRALADKYEVSKTRLGQLSKKEKWVGLRNEYRDKYGAKIIQKTAEKRSDSESKIAAHKEKCREAIWEQLERRILDEHDGVEFRRLAQTYRDMMEIEPEKPDEDALARAAAILGSVESVIDG